MRYPIKRLCTVAVVVTLLNTTACGYLIYPERQGLRGERVDGTVVVLDAIGLLFFVLPGVVAFAVDFSTGCIYLPKGHDGPFSMNASPMNSSVPEDWVVVAQVAPHADDATIAQALENYLGADAEQTAHIEWRSAASAHTN